MDENVFAALALDEAEALAGIEPLHCTLFFTHCLLFSVSRKPAEHYIELSDAPSPEPLNRAAAVFKLVRNGCKAVDRAKKWAASVTLRPLYYPKAIQEQQTQGQSTTKEYLLQEFFLIR